jgi:hypothetical protein
MAAWIEVSKGGPWWGRNMTLAPNVRGRWGLERAGCPTHVPGYFQSKGRRYTSLTYRARPTGTRSGNLGRAATTPFEVGVLAACANLEKSGVSFPCDPKPIPSHFYSTIECRVSGLLLDTPRRVESSVTRSKQSIGAHSTRHLFKGCQNAVFGRFPHPPRPADIRKKI